MQKKILLSPRHHYQLKNASLPVAVSCSGNTCITAPCGPPLGHVQDSMYLYKTVPNLICILQLPSVCCLYVQSDTRLPWKVAALANMIVLLLTQLCTQMASDFHSAAHGAYPALKVGHITTVRSEGVHRPCVNGSFLLVSYLVQCLLLSGMCLCTLQRLVDLM